MPFAGASALLLFSFAPVAEAMPAGAMPLDAPDLPKDYRLHLEFSAPAAGTVDLGGNLRVELGKGAEHDIAVERPEGAPPVVRVFTDGKPASSGIPAEPAQQRSVTFPDAGIDFGGDMTLSAKFETRGDGTLVSKCSPEGKWAEGAKALFVERGKLTFDVFGVGAIAGGRKVTDGKSHNAVLVVRGGTAILWLDGKSVASKPNFTAPDAKGDVLKIGSAAPNFGGNLDKGKVAAVRAWKRALADDEVALLFKGEGEGANTPDFTRIPDGSGSRPVVTVGGGASLSAAWIQPLENSDHRAIVSAWDEKSLAGGREIYTTLCTVCHGDKKQEGSLPTALRFHQGQFKNGSDPYSMVATLTKGYGQMVPQNQYTTAQKYAVVQYIRETFLRDDNKSQFTEVTPAYLASLPMGMTTGKVEKADRSLPQYKLMDFGPALFWTLQVERGNIAQKAIAIRLDEGAGGVSKGKAWMVYDHDTMRVATATTGDFVDWRGIAFDGSHGSHTSLTGDRHFVNPVGPGWASPEGKWNDERIVGRDDLRYGPLPKSWMTYEGLYLDGNKAVISMTIGGTPVLESPGWLNYGTTPVFTRTLNVGAAEKPLLLRVAPESVSVALSGDGSLRKDGGFWVAELPGGARTRILISRADPASLAALEKQFTSPLELEALTKGGPQRWTEEVTTTSEAGEEVGAFAADNFPLPVDNPWNSWMRPGGFDFTPDGKAAIVATWNGDVWRVDGITSPAPAALKWRRIASGLFQPLGVKFRGDELFITCRDQLVQLQDLNGDGETDYIRCFNNDAQVTEHFHEFAMGLQTDDEGNFYYAKSARHAKPALVPHHGTLLRVSADGSRTDIVANGFRAANGVCLNPDGTFFVTDQEGHWTPKNRINRVKAGGFYGNMFGYTDVTDTSDSAMEQPMVWMTNAKDRSPAELLWVPEKAWGPLGGSLLNLSYGTGRAFIVPNEEVGGQWQGAVCELPMPAFKTGIMRGRFGADGSLYTCGMFAWAGNATAPGGFHRIRHTGKAAHLPLAIHAAKGKLTLAMSDPVDPGSVEAGSFSMKAWNLKRTANYGSQHIDEHPVKIVAAKVAADGKTITLDIPDLEPTQSYELLIKLRSSDGTTFERAIHGTIHKLLATTIRGGNRTQQSHRG